MSAVQALEETENRSIIRREGDTLDRIYKGEEAVTLGLQMIIRNQKLKNKDFVLVGHDGMVYVGRFLSHFNLTDEEGETNGLVLQVETRNQDNSEEGEQTIQEIQRFTTSISYFESQKNVRQCALVRELRFKHSIWEVL